MIFDVLRFIAGRALWFYPLLALAFVGFLVAYLRTRRETQVALFGLELEVAKARLRRLLGLLLLVVVLASALFVFVSFIEPRLPAHRRVSPTPTRDIFSTPPPTFSNQTPTVTATSTPTATVVLETPQFQPTAVSGEPEEATQEASPTAQVAPGAVCEITSPADGAQVSGVVTFGGNVTADQFQFYKLEAYGPQTAGTWASLLGGEVTTPVQDGPLGTADFSAWAPGGYSIRVVVVDATYNEVATCYLTLHIVAPQ